MKGPTDLLSRPSASIGTRRLGVLLSVEWKPSENRGRSCNEIKVSEGMWNELRTFPVGICRVFRAADERT